MVTVQEPFPRQDREVAYYPPGPSKEDEMRFGETLFYT